MIDRVVAAGRALAKVPDLVRHLTELEVRVAVCELDAQDFDRDLGHVEAIVREHHMGRPTPARRGAR